MKETSLAAYEQEGDTYASDPEDSTDMDNGTPVSQGRDAGQESDEDSAAGS